jgi:hypothetical protein
LILLIFWSQTVVCSQTHLNPILHQQLLYLVHKMRTQRWLKSKMKCCKFDIILVVKLPDWWHGCYRLQSKSNGSLGWNMLLILKRRITCLPFCCQNCLDWLHGCYRMQSKMTGSIATNFDYCSIGPTIFCCYKIGVGNRCWKICCLQKLLQQIVVAEFLLQIVTVICWSKLLLQIIVVTKLLLHVIVVKFCCYKLSLQIVVHKNLMQITAAKNCCYKLLLRIVVVANCLLQVVSAICLCKLMSLQNWCCKLLL